MDPDTFWIITGVIIGISIIISLVVLIVGCVCFKPEKILMKVYPYIKESGNDIKIFGFIIKKKLMMSMQWFYTVYVIAWILFIVLFNTFLTISTKYNPYDGLDCFGYYENGSEFEVESEEQAEMENVTSILCVGWNFDIAGGIGHAAAILTISWLFASIVLWVKLKIYYKVGICIRNGKKVLSLCGLMGVTLFQSMFLFAPIFMLKYLFNELSLYHLLDIILFIVILLSGVTVFPSHKRPKSLAEYCKAAVENNQRKEEDALVPIKNRLRRRVQDHQSQVDLLVELAELECKKALGYVYYYGIKKDMNTCTCACMANCSCMNTEDDEEAETNTDTISEREMKIIAQVAYYKVTKDLQQQNNYQGYYPIPADDISLKQLPINISSGGDDQEDESAELLKRTRHKTTYVQLQ